MNRPLISVVIPYHNRADVIGRAVASALRQTHSNIEVIVVDDASAAGDKLFAALGTFSDSRIRLIQHETNQGGGAARNTGVSEAKGEFVAFLDSDDEWLPTKLERQVALAASLGDVDWLIYSQSEVVTTQPSGLQRSVMPLGGIPAEVSVGDYLFAGRGWLPTPAMFLPRQLACQVPFNPELKRHQDYDFLLRLEAMGCRFAMIPEPLVVVHWEDFHQTARGLNPSRSLEFLNEYKGYLSPRARSGFVFDQIVMRLMGVGRRVEALNYACRYVRPWHLSPVRFVSLISTVIFGDTRISSGLAVIKRSLPRSRPGEV
jgi:glycosyltransferase involved in cell wall biosynthesis